MKKLSGCLFALSVLLGAAFVWLLVRDYQVFYPYGSAPFYAYVLVRALELLLPAGACILAGALLKKRDGKPSVK